MSVERIIHVYIQRVEWEKGKNIETFLNPWRGYLTSRYRWTKVIFCDRNRQYRFDWHFKTAKSMPYNSTWQGGCHLWNYMGCLFIGNVLCFVLCATCHISFQLRHFLVEIVHFVRKLRPAQQPAIFEDCWQYHRKSLVFSAFVRVCQWEEGWYWCVMWRSLLEIRGLDPHKTPFHLRNLPQIKTCLKTKIASFFPVIWFRQHIVYFCGLGNFKKSIQLEIILNWYFFKCFYIVLMC